jgi:hypothetical protein
MKRERSLTLRIPDELATVIERQAAAERRTVSAIVRNLLLDWAQAQRPRARRKPLEHSEQPTA